VESRISFTSWALFVDMWRPEHGCAVIWNVSYLLKAGYLEFVIFRQSSNKLYTCHHQEQLFLHSRAINSYDEERRKVKTLSYESWVAGHSLIHTRADLYRIFETNKIFLVVWRSWRSTCSWLRKSLCLRWLFIELTKVYGSSERWCREPLLLTYKL
jgi:hypothetical protein